MDKKSMIIIAIIIAVWTISYAYQYNQSSQKSYDIVVSEKGIAFKTAEGKTVAAIMMGKDGCGQLAVFNKQGKPLVMLTADDETGAMAIANGEAKVLILLTTDNESGKIGILDVNGEPVWSKP
jgi:hypothetical protein